MPRDKTCTSPAPRYLRATAISTLAASAIPAAFMLYAIYDVQHGPPVDASEAQGLAMILAYLLAAIAFVAIAFPLVGWHLYKRQGLTRQRFYKALFVMLAVASLIPAALLAAMGFGASAFVLAPASFTILATLTLPLRPLWLKVAI